jgi:1,4-dihydroxy-2-naphthoate octaprenyltransferase
MSTKAVEPGSFKAWVLAARVPTLAAALVPVAVGGACAAYAGGFALVPVLAALFGACAIQIGTNFANDVFDFEKGADTTDRVGPTRAAQAGLLTPRALKIGIAVAFGLSALAGLYLVSLRGYPILAIGIVSILAGIAYTGGPFPLAYHGLGDVFVIVFFGFVAVMGTEYVSLGHVTNLSVLAAIPVGALATCILVVNNVRDEETDRIAGKRTVIVRFGRRFGHLELLAMLISAYAVPVVFFSRGMGITVLLPLVLLPFAVSLARSLYESNGHALNLTLVRAAKHLLGFGLLFTIGLVFARQ